MLILTDFPRFPIRWKTSSGVEGKTRLMPVEVSVKGLCRLIPDIRQADLIIIQQNVPRMISLVLLFALAPFLRKPIVSVDLLLDKPLTKRQRISAWLKKQLLGRVDHFIHYFKALDGYEKIYGISSRRSSYVPFKANLFANPLVADIAPGEKEEYVYAAGWSLRDYDTFFEAVSRLDYPAAIPQPNFERLREHGSRFSWRLEKLPRNLVLLPHDGSRESWTRNLCKARVVVIPIVRDTLRSSGISVYLDAMLLKKCVIISSGPGVSDVLEDQAVIVPPEDPAALAEAIRNVWENPVLREEVALRGQRYAESLGGESALMNRILESAVNWRRETSRSL